MSERIRGFEIAKGFEEKLQDSPLPVRKSENSAGYDFVASDTVQIKSFIRQFFSASKYVTRAIREKVPFADMLTNLRKILKPALVPTGIKAYMPEDEALMLFNRSSNPLKTFLVLSNGVGVIDSDYYENPGNDGNIMFQFWNFGPMNYTINKGETIGQGIFMKYLKADNDVPGKKRVGGFGSTDEVKAE